MNSSVANSTGKEPFELFYSENVMVPLDYLTGTTQLSRVQDAGEIAEEVLRLVNAANTELETA